LLKTKEDRKFITQSIKFCLRSNENKNTENINNKLLFLLYFADDLITENIKIGSSYEIIAWPMTELIDNRIYFYFEV